MSTDYESLAIDAEDLLKDITFFINSMASSNGAFFCVSDWDDYYNLIDDIRPLVQTAIRLEHDHRIDLNSMRVHLRSIIDKIVDAMASGANPDLEKLGMLASDARTALEDATRDIRSACRREAEADARYMQAGIPVYDIA